MYIVEAAKNPIKLNNEKPYSYFGRIRDKLDKGEEYSVTEELKKLKKEEKKNKRDMKSNGSSKFNNKIKDKISKGDVVSLKDIENMSKPIDMKNTKYIYGEDEYGNEEPAPGTDAYYIKHGLPFMEPDPYN